MARTSYDHPTATGQARPYAKFFTKVSQTGERAVDR